MTYVNQRARLVSVNNPTTKGIVIMGMRSGRLVVTSAVSTLTPFQRAAMSGRSFPSGVSVGCGYLPDGHAADLAAVAGPVYVVFSYRTPIAWHTAEAGWTTPAVTYSPTTTGHQGIARLAAFDRTGRLLVTA